MSKRHYTRASNQGNGQRVDPAISSLGKIHATGRLTPVTNEPTGQLMASMSVPLEARNRPRDHHPHHFNIHRKRPKASQYTLTEWSSPTFR